jgi:hypothetical protein
MSKEAMKLALEALEWANKEINEWRDDAYGYDAEDQPIIMAAVTALRLEIDAQNMASKQAQQEPRIDIYRSFEQWKIGNVLEHGVPQTEHYSEAQLDLVEMGWNYGYDAGRAVEQALDKMAENARDLGLTYEPAQYSDIVSDGGLDPRNKFDKPAQRTWVGLTDEEIERVCVPLGAAMLSFTEVARAIEAKLKEKNT